jgi:hypothetical protein
VLLVSYLVVGTGLLTSLYMLLFARSAETNPVALGGSGFGVVWFAYMWFAPRFFARRQFKNHPIAQSQITLNVSEQGLEFHNPHAASKVAWSAYVAWGESRSVFVILPQPRAYITIPKRAFTEEQVAQFRELLCQNIKSN